MFTLIYNHGEFNRPDNLLLFLQSNVGEWTLIQVDCITPYYGTKKELIQDVCEYLNHVSPDIEVTYNITNEYETTSSNAKKEVNYLVMQIQITQR